MADLNAGDKLATLFEAPGTLPRPGPIGRVVRLVLGVVIIWSLVPAVLNWRGMLRVGAPDNLSWIITVFLIVWLVPYVVNIGWHVNWQRVPRYAAVTLLAASALGGLPVWHDWWNPLFGMTLLLLAVYTLGHLGASFVLSAILATPGCEMRAIPDLRGRITGKRAAEHYCPGWMDPLDRWESRRGTGS